MKINKFIIIFIISQIFFLKSFALECENIEDWFEKYKCRIQKTCEVYNDNKKVFNTENYKSIESYKENEINKITSFLSSWNEIFWIKKAVDIYKNNMNNVYKCSILWAQKNSLLKLKKVPTNKNVKTSFSQKLEEVLQKIKKQLAENKCLNIDKETIYNKLSILNQTTYLTCDYSFYMEYLKDYYKNPANALWIDEKDLNNTSKETKEYSMLEASRIITSIKSDIDIEVANAYKIFPIAYHAYSEYENNFPVHFLMLLLKEDFYVFREKLHKVLNPINQVVYKISNAMKK